MVQILVNQLVDASRQFHIAVTALHEKRHEQEKRRERIGASRIMMNPDVLFYDENLIDDNTDNNNNNNNNSSHLVVAMPMLQPAQQQRLMTPQTNLLLERASEIHDIEENIIEIGVMMRQLAEHAAIQNEQILRIDDDLMMAETHTTEAHRQLTHYLSAISNNRWLAVKIFGVLLFFIVLFVMFFI
jgi:syntaxin 5